MRLSIVILEIHSNCSRSQLRFSGRCVNRDQVVIGLFQVTSLTEYPDLLSEENLPTTSKLFPKDAIARAEQILKEIGSTGAYSHSQGIPLVRKHVAQYISERDGFEASPDDVFLCNGASPGVQTCLQIMVQNNNVGVMIPIPQYPLYTASLALFNAKPVPYYLSEEKDWGLDPKDLEEALAKAKKDGVDTRGLVIINPGNPTGNLLSEDNMRLILEFCSKNRIVLMADEVYQTNVYNAKERPWISFKKVLRQLEKEGKIPTLGKGSSSSSHVELISFHSTSKGFVGECGRRGGYFELTNIDKEVKEQIYKIASVSLCPAVQGQIAVDLMVNPPKQGDESYPLYEKESAGILTTLKHRSELLANTFNKMSNTSCNSAQGAMYLFPKFEFSEKFQQHAKKQNKGPDDVYAMMLLEKTGICVVPGGGFGQREGTYHIRTTFLAPGEDEFGKAWKTFHEDFVQEWHAV